MLRFVAFVAVSSLALVALVLRSGSGAPPAAACTGGVGPLEWLTSHAELIVLGEAIEVGDAVNRAPTATATQTPTATSTPSRGKTTAKTASPTSTPSPFEPRPFDLTGIGMTLRVERAYVGGASGSIAIDANVRSAVERGLQDIEAGRMYISDCALDAFVPRFSVGVRYLLFIVNAPEPYTAGVFIVDGQDVVLDDPALVRAGNDQLYLSPETYQRFFAGLPASSRYAGELTLMAGRVPLARVLRAIAFLRGDPSIAPPETGSAGLASGRW
jgi:hypothetical protein